MNSCAASDISEVCVYQTLSGDIPERWPRRDSIFPGFSANVFHRVRDLPSVPPRIEVGHSLGYKPGGVPLLVRVVVTHGERRTFRQLDPEPLDVVHGLRAEIAGVQVGHDAMLTVAHS